MFNMNERVYNPQSQIQSAPHHVSSTSFSIIHQQTSQAAAVSLQSSADHIQVVSSLVVPYFLLTDDPLECLNKALTFMSTILALSYPSSNNQLETSLNPMHQVAMPERQTLSCVGNCLTGNDHIARSYTQSKKIQCLKQQMLLTQLQEVGIQLSKDQLAILADTEERINFGLGAFTVTTNALFQADRVEVYDSNCDDVPNTQPSFMANILSYGSDALAEVNNPNNVDNNMINQSVQNSNSSAQQDALILSVIEQLKSQVINCTKINVDNKSVNDTLTAELKRYTEQVKVLKEGQNVDLKSKDNISDLCEQPTKVEVLKELPKVSMVNTSLKKLKHHLAGFDVVVKERTTTTAITDGSWGFEHTKACFRDKIIPFVKALKDIFNRFDQYLIDKLTEVQNLFHQMEQAVEQHSLESKTFEVKMNKVLNENERLLKQVINKDIVNIIMNSSVENAYVNVHECEKCLKLETELLNK
ncbi:hypothetical protein Tco_0097327 [Tanacetum coccineum]